MAEKEKETETAPDPEEDDLDDLDDVLDEFQPKPTTTPAPTASGPGRPPQPTAESAVEDAPGAPSSSEEDMTAHLQAGMSSLISELGENPEMQAQFEAMMQELVAAGAAPTDKEAAEHIRSASESMPQEIPTDEKGGGVGGKKEDTKFQETIRRTMERMQASDSAASTSSASAPKSEEEEMLAQMMRELSASGSGGGGGGGEGGEEDFNSMLMGMMTQLTNKEILYEPMKELHDKFPAWMEANRDKTKKADMQRYEEQKMLVGEIVGRFEAKGYSDESEADREFIVERMQKMQAAGSPPPDLVGDMSAAQEALGDMEAGCPTQ